MSVAVRQETAAPRLLSARASARREKAADAVASTLVLASAADPKFPFRRMIVQSKLQVSAGVRLGAICAGALLATTIGAAGAHAQEAAGPTVSFNVGAFSDYVFRGVSQTDENPAVQGGADLTAGKFYAGVWGSNVDFNDKTDAEVDLYGGFKPTVGPVTLDLGVIYYGYVGAPKGAGYANWEVKAAGSVPAGKGSVGAAVYYSPDSFGAADDAVYYEANGAYPLTEKLSLSGAVGRQTYEGTGDYTTWNLGSTWAFAPHLAADLRYFDTDEHGFGKIYGGRAVVSLKASF